MWPWLLDDCYGPASGNECFGIGESGRLFTCYCREHLWKSVKGRWTHEFQQCVGLPRVIKERGGRTTQDRQRYEAAATAERNDDAGTSVSEHAVKRNLLDILDIFPYGDGIFHQDNCPCHKATHVDGFTTKFALSHRDGTHLGCHLRSYKSHVV